jgi:hypothetical protein
MALKKGSPRVDQGKGIARMRTLAVDDLFRIEQIGCCYGGPFSFSPDGGTLAYVLQRPKETVTLHTQRPPRGQ